MRRGSTQLHKLPECTFPLNKQMWDSHSKAFSCHTFSDLLEVSCKSDESTAGARWEQTKTSNSLMNLLVPTSAFNRCENKINRHYCAHLISAAAKVLLRTGLLCMMSQKQSIFPVPLTGWQLLELC